MDATAPPELPELLARRRRRRAGPAGPMAARRLQAAGRKVVVLEARERVGGRTGSREVDGAPSSWAAPSCWAVGRISWADADTDADTAAEGYQHVDGVLRPGAAAAEEVLGR